MAKHSIAGDNGDQHFEFTDAAGGPTTAGDLTGGLKLFYDDAVFTTKDELLRALNSLQDHLLEKDYPTA